MLPMQNTSQYKANTHVVWQIDAVYIFDSVAINPYSHHDFLLPMVGRQ